jgi:glutamate N-acetyltransferase/amino-acid N-acetyltransferase
VLSAITRPRGFKAAGVACGIKPGRPDLMLIAAERACPAAAVFTTNLAPAAPIVLSRRHLAAGRARAVVANAGCANAATGARGMEDARRMAELAGAGLGARAEEIVVASTGVIGVPLPMERVSAGIAAALAALTPDGGADAARAILTTDTRPKEAFAEVALGGSRARIGAMAKGAGMIAPRMATMLAFFTTDAAIEPAPLKAALVEAMGESLNRVTVDGDTSTNDMALILASGEAGNDPIRGPGAAYDAFRDALAGVAREIALMIVRDGEGVTRVAEVRIEGARDTVEADRVARAVAESLLVKTALHGGDPNWGRILAAVGRAGVPVDDRRVDIFLGDVWVAEGGSARDYPEERARAALVSEDPVRIRIRLNAGSASSWMLTSDISKAYVDINASYRS